MEPLSVLLCCVVSMSYSTWLSAGVVQSGEVRLSFAEIALLVRSQMHARNFIVSCARGAEPRPDCDRAGKIFIGVGTDGDHHANLHLFELDAPALSSLGGMYVLRPTRPISLTIDAMATSEGLQLTLDSRDDVRFVVECVSGACFGAGMLPLLVWRSPHISARIGVAMGEQRLAETDTAVAYGRSLEIQQLLVSGHFDLTCLGGWGLAPVICAAARAVIGPDVTWQVRAAINDIGVRVNVNGIASLASSALGTTGVQSGPVGDWRSLRVLSIAGDTRGVRISFCLWPNCT
ncbi:MAG: hypothetical protein AB7I44_10455 [Hyphomicrobiaceae bacterium]